MASKPPIALYRRILKLHRGLPEQVRLIPHRNRCGLCAASLATVLLHTVWVLFVE